MFGAISSSTAYVPSTFMQVAAAAAPVATANPDREREQVTRVDQDDAAAVAQTTGPVKAVDDGTYQPVTNRMVDQAALTGARENLPVAGFEPLDLPASENRVIDLDSARETRKAEAAAPRTQVAQDSVVETPTAQARVSELTLASEAKPAEPVPVKSYMEF